MAMAFDALVASSTAQSTPPVTSAMLPLPLEPRTLTATSSAFFATPYVLDPMVPAQ